MDNAVVFFRSSTGAALWLVLLISPLGCGRSPSRPTSEIVIDKMVLPTVFLSEKTHQEVIAPANTQPVHNGEPCWPAYTCTHPDCPGEGNSGRPYLFINSIPGSDTYCAACLRGRDPAELSAEKQREYLWAVKPYVLPEAARRLKELDEEHKRRIEQLKRRKERKP